MGSSGKRFFQNILRRIKLIYSAIHFRLKSLFGFWTHVPLRIDDYGGFARSDYLFLKGRVLADRFITNTNQDSIWRILINNYRRFGSREIQGAAVVVEFGRNTFTCTTDVEGYFIVDDPLEAPVEAGDRIWQRAFCRVIKTPWQKVDVGKITEIMVLSPEKKRGVISDVDDTILKTDLNSLFKLKALYQTLLKHAAGRRAFHRGAAFYQALERGLNDRLATPFFYVSNSPWNLHDMLVDFMEINGLPGGPILLRDIGLPHQKRPKDYRGHKYEHIIKILETYPGIRFILIGDTGEGDPRIYLSVDRQYPDRIEAIYLRDIDSRKRRKKLEKLLEEYKPKASVCIFKSYEEAEQHAEEKGYTG